MDTYWLRDEFLKFAIGKERLSEILKLQITFADKTKLVFLELNKKYIWSAMPWLEAEMNIAHQDLREEYRQMKEEGSIK